MKQKIAIITGSTRIGRVSKSVAKWVLAQAPQSDKFSYELVDIFDYNLPFLGTTDDLENTKKWNDKINELDAFIFVVAEYNHSITGALKNALDLAKEAWRDKSAGIVSYGGAGGSRAAEHLRGILSGLQVASVRAHVLLSLFEDFEDFKKFKPRNLHLENLQLLFGQVENWATALQTIR